MKKLFLLVALAAATSGIYASAETLTPYTEQFENPTYRPKGWLRGGASSYSQGTMTVSETGGHSGGYISVDQYSNYWSSYYNNYNYCDMLVTPKVEGEVSIWVRKNGAEPTLTFYNISDVNNIPTSVNQLTMLEGTDKNLLGDKTAEEWTQITVSGVPAGTNLGIRAHNLDLDEFTATKAEVLYRVGLSVSVTNTLDNKATVLEANEQNEVTFKFKVGIENYGDIDFPASDSGFEIKLVNAANDNAVFGTGNLTEAIVCGQTVEKDFTMTGVPQINASAVTNQYKVLISHEKTNSIEASLGYFQVIPYAPEAKLMFFEDNDKNQSNYNDVDITDLITVGAGQASTAKRTLWLWNKGTATMKVTGVSVGEGFAVDVDAFDVPAKEKKAITVSLQGEPGLKLDTLRITAEGIGEKKYAVQGLVTAEGDYLEGFNDETTPAGMVFDKNVKHVATPDALKPLGGEKYVEYTSSYGSAARVISPKLTFGKDEQFHFMAAKSDNTSATLAIFISPDRVNWTAVDTIDTRKEDALRRFNVDKPTGTGYGTYEMRIFSVDMPEGDYYVALDLKGARIDNFMGGKKVDVNHDLYVVTHGLPTEASVNTRYISTITLRNILDKTEEDYEVILLVDGDKVGSATETPAIAAGEEASFDVRYTPHAAGTFTGTMAFVAGTDTVPLHSFEFTVGPEKAEATYQVGDIKITTSDPLQTFYNTQAQMIYRKESLGMDNGVKITGFHFVGYNTKELTKNVKVWIENTDVDKYDFSNIEPGDPSKMTLVYEGQYTFPVCGDNSAKEYEPVFVVPFNVPFTYTGSNVRIVVEQTNLTEDAETANVFFAVDNSVYDYRNDVYDDRVIENKQEFAEDLDDEPSWNGYKAGFPVTYFNVAKDVVVMKGKVSDEFGAPIEGASVVLNSDDIQYSATTDAEGSYSMNIANVALTYTVDVTATGFTAIAEEGLTFDVATSLEEVKDYTMEFADRTATLSGTVTTSLANCEGVEGATVTLTQSDVSVTATTDAKGAYTLTVAELTGEYTLTVSMAGEEYVSETYTFASKAETKDFAIAYSSISAVKAAKGDKTVIYDLNGRRVNRAAKGVYIINGRKTLIAE